MLVVQGAVRMSVSHPAGSRRAACMGLGARNLLGRRRCEATRTGAVVGLSLQGRGRCVGHKRVLETWLVTLAHG